MALDNVLSPIFLGSVEIPNRVVRTAHGTGFAHTDFTDEFIAFHEERARGGCGLTILEAASVHPSSRLELGLFGENIVKDYQRLAAACRPHGMKLFQQLWHGGNLYNGYDGPPLAVSTVPGYGGVVGRPMTDGEIWELVQAFVDCSVRAQQGGLDGVEIHAGHGYIFQQFFSTYYNNRTDDWGGDLDGRMRFLVEVLRAVRKAVSGKFAVGVRLSSSEAPGGVSEADNRQILARIQGEGLIDYVNVSKGDYYRMDTMVGTMTNPTGYELSSASQVLEVASVPRMVAGRFRTLEEAEQVIREGTADLVSMVRAHIADPNLVAKSRAGHIEQVRPCISCNQGCIGGATREGRIGCLANPAVGFEASLSEHLITRTEAPKKVLIVGGGPAGMEAARIAATIGHTVVLCEASPDLGGLVNVAKRAPKLATLADITVWLEQEVYRLGVEVRLNSYMDADDIRAEGADVVIIATGAQPRVDGFQIDDPGQPTRGSNLPHVMSSVDAITDKSRITGTTALIYDSVGHFESFAVAEHLLQQGIAVTMLSPHPSLAPYAQTTWREIPALERFYQMGGFTPLVRHRLVEIQPGRCLVRPSQAGANQLNEVPADNVILISPNEPLRELYDALRDECASIFLIGDALSPRDVQVAIREGHRTARTLN